MIEQKLQLDQEPTTDATYLLRDIPRELWDAAKHRTITERITLRELIFRALGKYLGRDGK